MPFAFKVVCIYTYMTLRRFIIVAKLLQKEGDCMPYEVGEYVDLTIISGNLPSNSKRCSRFSLRQESENELYYDTCPNRETARKGLCAPLTQC